MKSDVTIIELTPFEAASFVQFQKHREIIQLLERADAFGLRSGSCEIHFDAFGKPISAIVHKYIKN